MARVERSTSSGGKRYLTDKVVAFDTAIGRELKLGGVDNGNGSLEIYDENDVLYVTGDKSGLTLTNGAKIIGGDGLLTQMVIPASINSTGFIGTTMMLPCGYSMLYTNEDYSLVTKKDQLTFEFTIPKGFTISSAYINLYHMPVKYYTNGVLTYTGYSRSMELYYSTSFTGGIMDYEFVWGEIKYNSAITFSSVTNAFGAGGFTGSASAYTTAKSIDVKSSITTSTSADSYNIMKVETSVATPTTEENLYTKTGAMKADLVITGYTVFE